MPEYTETEAQKETREKNFVYHPPKGTQTDRYASLRLCGNEFARALNESCPPSRELSLAMTNLEQAIFWANAAIARNE